MASGRLGGLTPILLATAVAGVAGYLIQFLVPLRNSPAEYLKFSVFWAALYLGVSALSGIQQEVSRAATTAVSRDSGSNKVAFRFTFGAVGLTLVLVPLSALVWGSAVFPDHTVVLIAALTLGCASYLVVAALSGIFYGLQMWVVVAVQTVIDAGLRLLFVGLGVMFRADVDVLVWCVVAPFPLTVLIMWFAIRRRVAGMFRLDVTANGLAWNAARTVVGACATGILVSGFPLLLDATSRGESEAALGVLVLVITLTRAPLVVPLLALQSFLTVHFRGRVSSILASVLSILGGVLIVTFAASALAFALGPDIIVFFYGEEYSVSAAVVGLIVASSGLTAALCVTGPAVLARGQHGAFLAGWLGAALAMTLILLMPLPMAPRAIGALAFGPLIGLLIHLGALILGARQSRAEGRVAQTPQ
jgi:O-antigen/teichoic acid export membrane protein